MAIEYLNSNQVKMFPSAFRGEGIDATSYLTTEKHLTTISLKVTNNKLSYWYDDPEDNTKICIVADGYFFYDISKSNISSKFSTSLEDGTIIYALINTVDLANNTRTLVVYDEVTPTPGHILDVGTSFKGLAFDTSLPSGIATSHYVPLFKLETVSDVKVWNLISSSKLNISASQVEDQDGKSIKETLHTDLLTSGNTQIDGTLTVGTKSTNEKATQLNGTVEINNQTTGFAISGGKTTSKTLSINNDVTVNTPLDVGSSGNTGKITIKQNNNKTLTIAGASTSNQTLTFNGTSTFQGGNYSCDNTSGSENVVVGGKSFNPVTRDTNQTITKQKIFDAANGLVVKNKTYAFDDTPASNNWDATLKFWDKDDNPTADVSLGIGTTINAIQMAVQAKDGNNEKRNVRLVAERVVVDNTNTTSWYFIPSTNNQISLGTSSNKWSDVRATNAHIDKIYCADYRNASNGRPAYNGSNLALTSEIIYPTTFTWSNGTTAGPTGSLTGNSGFSAVSFGAIPSANENQSGIVTTSTQTFKGNKKFLQGAKFGNDSYQIDSSGNCTMNTFTATSDERLKENIVDYTPSKSILDLSVKEFDLKEDGSHHIGCIAQDLQKIAPELVHENENGFLSIEEGKLVYLLLDEVKKLRKELDELKRD